MKIEAHFAGLFVDWICVAIVRLMPVEKAELRRRLCCVFISGDLSSRNGHTPSLRGLLVDTILLNALTPPFDLRSPQATWFLHDAQTQVYCETVMQVRGLAPCPLLFEAISLGHGAESTAKTWPPTDLALHPIE
jgi:hypothetical protein